MQLSQSAGRSRIQGLFAGRFSCEVLTSQSRLGQYSEAYRFRWSECTSCFVWTGANFADCWEDFTVRVGTQTTRLTSGDWNEDLLRFLCFKLSKSIRLIFHEDYFRICLQGKCKTRIHSRTG
ncbi:hypothetical protein L6452_13628 [Arctium lappa]|uniref:Uncharacterized protein n=1 Tax=Arctium lappa TaxID=4217 RepID=A0ACB9CJ19_ARCLA|nr:hypothetical protein L6452_13628 [Arctium lappa]